MKGRMYRDGTIEIEDKYDSEGHIIPWFKLKKEIKFNSKGKLYAIEAEFKVKE
jgi:hypothetical protein